MKGYGIYFEHILIGWHKNEGIANDIRNMYRGNGYSIKPTEIGILMEPCGTEAPVPQPGDVRRGTELKFEGKPYAPYYEAIKEALDKIPAPGVDVTATKALTEEDIIKLREAVKRIEPGIIKPVEELKLGHCGKYCNGCDYSTPEGDCIVEDEPCNLINSDGYCLIDVTPCTTECEGSCAKRAKFKKEYKSSEVKKDLQVALRESQRMAINFAEFFDTVGLKTIDKNGKCKLSEDSECKLLGTPCMSYPVSTCVLRKQYKDAYATHNILIPYKDRGEWLADNPLKKLMEAHSIGYIKLSNLIARRILSLRLQKLANGLEAPEEWEYTELSVVFDYLGGDVLRRDWDTWLVNKPEKI